MRELDALRAQSPTAPIILVTTFSLGFNYLKLLYYLKKNGAIVVLMTGAQYINGAHDIQSLSGKGYFDALWVANPFVHEMPYLAKHYDFDIIHALVGTYSPYPFSELLRHAKSPVIIDYIDFRELMYDDGNHVDREAHKHAFNIIDSELEFTLWHDIFTLADGIIYKDSPLFFNHLTQKHKHTPKAIEFQSYVCKEWICDNKRNKNEFPVRAVFAGGLQQNKGQHDYKTCETTFDVAKTLVKQGFEFTIYNGCDAGQGGFEHYNQLAQEESLFHYNTAIPNDMLAQALCTHDIGWNYQHFEQGTETAFCHGNVMSSKIFNFLEAGLPIISSKYTGYVTHYLKTHSIGFGVTQEDIADFRNVVRSQDWKSIYAAVIRAQDDLSMERHFPRLAAHYEDVCKKKLFHSNN
ncbi:hypothetical protein [Desulfovibrio inopinatus]|uniref:hypothetical protein n=1 Tax=Desulfovibrio inopinatus TaxID=102109 RepID=UPI0012EBC5F9|nr:hypothetical protein [Desulfovibrio inopinatus]